MFCASCTQCCMLMHTTGLLAGWDRTLHLAGLGSLFQLLSWLTRTVALGHAGLVIRCSAYYSHRKSLVPVQKCNMIPKGFCCYLALQYLVEEWVRPLSYPEWWSASASSFQCHGRCPYGSCSRHPRSRTGIWFQDQALVRVGTTYLGSVVPCRWQSELSLKGWTFYLLSITWPF